MLNYLYTSLTAFVLSCVYIYRVTLWFYARHFVGRVFRGDITTTMDGPIPGSTLYVYESGFVSMVHRGHWYDVALLQRRGIIPWKCKGTNGASLVTPPMRQEDAERYIADVGGPILFCDPKNGHIFFKENQN